MPLIVRLVVTPPAVFGIDKAIAPEDTVAEAGARPPLAVSSCAGPVVHMLAKDGETDTAVGVLATVTFVVAVLEQVPLLKV
jgi:hypothetical protein